MTLQRSQLRGLVLAAAFAITSCPPTRAGTHPSGNGDTNGDGKIDISDAVYLLLFLYAQGPPLIEIDRGWILWPESEGGNDHLYRLSSPGTWSEAEAEAVRLGGYIVTINDAPEQEWLNERFPPTAQNPNLWIGRCQNLSDPSCAPDCEPGGGWKWVSGEPATFLNWAPGEPNNDTRAVPSENVAVMHCFGLGLWCDFHDGGSLRGVIEVAFPCDRPSIAGFTFDGRNSDTGRDEYVHIATGIEFVHILGGEFLMGAQAANPAGPNFDPAARPEEGPVHNVRLSPYLIAKTEVTQRQWQDVLAAHPEIIVTTLPPDFPGDDYPMHQVSWPDCVNWLAAVGLVLPTEAQWENAGGGDGDLNDVAWWNDNSGDMAQPVGLKLPNRFGLHDTIGGMFEWCRDVYDAAFYAAAEAGGPDPLFDPGSGERVVRGGGWDSVADDCRHARRRGHPNRGSDIGFRPVFELR